MSSQLRVSVLTIPTDSRSVTFLRIVDACKVKVFLCFSQVSVAKCILDFNYSTCVDVKDFSSSMVRILEKNERLPDFDDLEAVDFPDYVSGVFSNYIDEISMNEGMLNSLESLYYEFMESNHQYCTLPGIELRKLEEVTSVIKEFNALFVFSQPSKVAIASSREQFRSVLKETKLREISEEILQELSKSALPKLSIDPIEWHEGPAAEAISFLCWLNVSE